MSNDLILATAWSFLSRTAKQQRALDAATAVAADLGLRCDRVVVLKDSRHTIVHLAPLPIAARVSPLPLDNGAKRKLEREVAVGRHLAAKEAPALAPSVDPPPGPYCHQDVALSLWPLAAHRPAEESDGDAGARALRRVHEAVADFPGALPSFTEAIDAYSRRLSDRDAFPGLAQDDKVFLRREHDRIRARFESFADDAVALHGDAHLGNLLIADDGPRWIDLEAVCRGPVEWDLACLPEAALPAYGDWNRGLERILRRLRRLSVVLWCAVVDDPTVEQREAVDHRLRILKRGA